jgi:subtilisin family serine protease
MSKRRLVRSSVFAGLLGLGLVGGGAALPVSAQQHEDSYIAVFSSPQSADRGQVERAGHRVTADLKQASVMIVKTSKPAALASLPGVVGVAKDKVRVRVPDEPATAATGLTATAAAAAATGCASSSASCPLQWDLARIHVPDAWKTTQGSPAIKVAVIDPGLTSSHEEVGPNYDRANSVSFVQPNSFCPADAATFASTEDFNGHGTWTATHIGGINGKFMTGIAPQTTLVNIRVLGACGFGFDSWVLEGMIYGGIIGARVESMSLGGYMCGEGVVPDSPYCGTAADVGTDPILWQAYQNVVQFLNDQDTLVVAAAGNDLVELNKKGRVLSRASLAVSSPTNDPGNDLHGLTEAPGGVPGVIAVAAVTRVTVPALNLTGPETKFGQFGVGRKDQLAYYSSYGERIDVSAPGGSRRYNVPRFDCLTPLCLALGPSGSGGTDNTGDFGALGVDGAGKPCGNCYAFIQGTSMATPQVAGAAALALAVQPDLTPVQLAGLLRRSVTRFTNANKTPPADEEIGGKWFNYDLDYDGAAIANRLMGSGVIDANLAVRRAQNGDAGGNADNNQQN